MPLQTTRRQAVVLESAQSQTWKVTPMNLAQSTLARTIAGTVTAALTLAALAPAAQAQTARKQVGKGEGQVDIVAWAGYIERGQTDKNFDWVTDFEKKTGCKVNVKTAGTSDEMVALMRSEERRVGKECLRQCRSRWSPYH